MFGNQWYKKESPLPTLSGLGGGATSLLYGGWGPIIDSATLAETDPGLDRFTSETFTVSIVMSDEGFPISSKQLKGYIDAPGGGTLQRHIETDDITNVSSVTVGDNWTIYDLDNNTQPVNGKYPYGYRGQWQDMAGSSVTNAGMIRAVGIPEDCQNCYNKNLMWSYSGFSWGASLVDGNTNTVGWMGIGFDADKDLFVAVGENGEVAYTDSSSSHFTTPTNDMSSIGSGWRSIASNESMWIAVSETLLTKVAKSSTDDPSDNSNTWSDQTVTSKHWISIAAKPGGRFVAVTYDSGSNNITYSDNGTSWTDVTSPNDLSSTQTYGWQSICYGGGRWVAVGNQGGQRAMWSSDGATWNAVNTPRSNMAGTTDDQGWLAVTYGDGKFVACGSGADYPTMYSIDGGETWTGVDDGTAQRSWNSIAYTSYSGFTILSSSLTDGNGNMHSDSATGQMSGRELTFSGSTDLSLFTVYDKVESNNHVWNSYPTGVGGTIFSINTGSKQITLAPYTGTWTNGMTAIGDTTVDVSKLYTVMNSNGDVLSLVPNDPGYTTMTGTPSYTLSFPTAFPTGDQCDADITPGATFTVDVRAINSSGKSDLPTNTVTPV